MDASSSGRSEMDGRCFCAMADTRDARAPQSMNDCLAGLGFQSKARTERFRPSELQPHQGRPRTCRHDPEWNRAEFSPSTPTASSQPRPRRPGRSGETRRAAGITEGGETDRGAMDLAGPVIRILKLVDHREGAATHGIPGAIEVVPPSIAHQTVDATVLPKRRPGWKPTRYRLPLRSGNHSCQQPWR